MTTCKDCLHCDVCHAVHIGGFIQECAEACKNFKDESRYIELPCKMGDVVYRIITMGTGVTFKKTGFNTYRHCEQTIKRFIRTIIVTKNNFYDIAFGGVWGTEVFASREDAEKALKGCE